MEILPSRQACLALWEYKMEQKGRFVVLDLHLRKKNSCE